MRILMDSDCLINLTKAGLKENICAHYQVLIPALVKQEVVDAGRIKGYPDATPVEQNIEAGIIKVLAGHTHQIKGDQALVEAFEKGAHNFVATDDAKLTRILKAAAIPFALPAVLIYLLFQRGIINQGTALIWLDRLSAFISDDEYATVKILLEGKT